MNTFNTNGHTVYHLKPATVDCSGSRVIIGAAYDGSVICHRTTGQRVWHADGEGGFPFDLCVADINHDGLDETLVASADGALRAYGADGRPLWTFRQPAPLLQVCVARDKDGTPTILAGGEGQRIYALAPDGTLIKDVPFVGPVRHLRAGNVLGDGRDVAAVTSTTGALAGKLTVALIDPSTLDTLWTRKDQGAYAHNSGQRFFSMLLLDVNADGKSEILLSGTWGDHGKVYGYDSTGELLFAHSDDRVPWLPYRMNLLAPVTLPNQTYFVGQFANLLIVYNADGTIREVLTGKLAYANACFDPVTRSLYLGSDISGGDEIVALRLDQPGWQQAFENAQPTGRIAEVIVNMETLEQQIACFEPPAYQPLPSDVSFILQDEYHVRTPEQLRRSELSGRPHLFINHLAPGQKPEPGELWCRDRSAFSRYDLTADEVLDVVRKWESRKQHFLLQLCHTTAFHMSLETLKRAIELGSDYLWGFELSEPGEKLNDREAEIIDGIVIPLADQCAQAGKRIVLRTKNIFWNGSIYTSPWRAVLMDPKYRDVFIPCLEETNSRTQEMSLSGRIGLWLSGVFDRWACRAETDNACFNRMWEWSSQQVFSHHLRNMVSAASLGCDVFFNGIHQDRFSVTLEEQLFPVYDMIAKGIIHVPKRSELACISPVAIAMREPDPAYLKHGRNGHGTTFPVDEHPPLVFDKLDTYWGATTLADHDFSRPAFGLKRRMLNFLPPTPNGMVTMIPAGATAEHVTRTIETDGRYYYDPDGKRHDPASYVARAADAVRDAAKTLPMRVEGESHTIASWLDDRHLRVTLIDPGYTDPASRDVEIVLQQDGFTACHDILSNESLPIQNNRVALRIPAGTLRIVDLTRG